MLAKRRRSGSGGSHQSPGNTESIQTGVTPTLRTPSLRTHVSPSVEETKETSGVVVRQLAASDMEPWKMSLCTELDVDCDKVREMIVGIQTRTLVRRDAPPAVRAVITCRRCKSANMVHTREGIVCGDCGLVNIMNVMCEDADYRMISGEADKNTHTQTEYGKLGLDIPEEFKRKNMSFGSEASFFVRRQDEFYKYRDMLTNLTFLRKWSEREFARHRLEEQEVEGAMTIFVSERSRQAKSTNLKTLVAACAILAVADSQKTRKKEHRFACPKCGVTCGYKKAALYHCRQEPSRASREKVKRVEKEGAVRRPGPRKRQRTMQFLSFD